MSNKELEAVLIDGKTMNQGIGGSSLQIDIDNTVVFVKKVPLTDLAFSQKIICPHLIF